MTDKKEYHEEMTLRDYFAAKATSDDIKPFIPCTVGEVASLMRNLGLIRQYSNAIDAYTDKDIAKLRAWAKYKYADSMIAAREVQP